MANLCSPTPAFKKVGLYITPIKAFVEYGTYVMLGCGETEEIVCLIDSNNDNEVTIVAYESWIDQSTKLSMCKLKEGDNQRSIFVKDVVDAVFIVRRSEMLGSPDKFIGRDGYYVLEGGDTWNWLPPLL
jgi:hypothetical protein